MAFDAGEDAALVCLMQSFPNPSFQWFRGSNIIHRSNPRFSTNETSLPEDVYSSQLIINGLTSEDYGEYTCKGENNMGEHQTIIKLQRKGPPEAPFDLHLISTGTTNLEVGWQEGFNGGIERTKFEAIMESELGLTSDYDCQRDNPCIIHNLDEQTRYLVQIKATNIKGESELSPALRVSTGVEAASIPEPEQVYFEHLNQIVSFRVGSTNLVLGVEVNKISEGNTEWEVISSQVPLSGKEYEKIAVDEKFPEKVQVRLCAVGEENLCGPYVEAEKG